MPDLSSVKLSVQSMKRMKHETSSKYSRLNERGAKEVVHSKGDESVWASITVACMFI